MLRLDLGRLGHLELLRVLGPYVPTDLWARLTSAEAAALTSTMRATGLEPRAVLESL